MKRIFSVTAAVILCLALFGCGRVKKPEITGGEIIVGKGEYSVSFTVSNKTGETVSGLTVGVKAFGKGGAAADEGEAVYPIDVENGSSATVVFKTDKACESAQAVWYLYTDRTGAEIKGEFDGEFKAYVKEKTGNDIVTREQLADEIIREVRDTFLKKGTYSTGSYDSDRKQLVIVSRYEDNYDTCASAYAKNPDEWKQLSDGVISMSQTYLELFKDKNFDDVSVTVGVMSDDEQIMFSATDGALKESFGEQ